MMRTFGLNMSNSGYRKLSNLKLFRNLLALYLHETHKKGSEVIEMYLFLKQNAGQNNLTRKERSDFLRNI